MRYYAILFLALINWCCSGQPKHQQTYWQLTPSNQQIFQLRFNQPASLLDRPELAAEIPAGKGWERVSLTNPKGNHDLVDQLLERMRAKPSAIHTVLADLRRRTVTWPGQHVCRVLVLVNLDPAPIKDDETTDGPMKQVLPKNAAKPPEDS